MGNDVDGQVYMLASGFGHRANVYTRSQGQVGSMMAGHRVENNGYGSSGQE